MWHGNGLYGFKEAILTYTTESQSTRSPTADVVVQGRQIQQS